MGMREREREKEKEREKELCSLPIANTHLCSVVKHCSVTEREREKE